MSTSQFSVNDDEEQKLRFAFCIYDTDKDGYIANGELFQVLKMMVGKQPQVLAGAAAGGQNHLGP